MPITVEQRAEVGKAVAYRSTVLHLASQHCPRAVDHYEAGADYDRTRFAVGIAAHAILQAVGEAMRAGRGSECYEEVADQVCLRLSTAGRTFDGKPEAPMKLDAAIAGRDLVAQWLPMNPLPADAHYELGIGVDRNWEPVPYGSEGQRYGQILDFARVDHEMLEEGSAVVLHIREYKTAWSAGRELFDTVQLRGQAVLATIALERGLLHPRYRDFGVLRREVINLRLPLREPYREELDGNAARFQMQQWRRDIEAQCEVLDYRGKDGLRPAVPGGGCIGCPFLLACDPGRQWLSGSSTPKTPWERGVAYAIAVGMAAQLKELLKVDTDEAMLPLRDGWSIGTVAEERLGPTVEAYALAWERWAKAGRPAPQTPEELDALGRGFAKALTLGAENLRKLAGVRWPGKEGRETRERFLAEVLAPSSRRAFGIHHIEEGGSDATATEV